MRILLTIFLTILTLNAFADPEIYDFELEKVKTEYAGEFFLRGDCKELNVTIGLFPGNRCLISEQGGKHYEQCEMAREIEDENCICHQYFSEKYMVTVGTSKKRPWEVSASCMKFKEASPNNIQKDIKK